MKYSFWISADCPYGGQGARLSARLRAAGHDVVASTDQSQIAIVLWCCHIAASADDAGRVDREIHWAWKHDRCVVPLRLCNGEVSPEVAQFHWIDCRLKSHGCSHQFTQRAENDLASPLRDHVMLTPSRWKYTLVEGVTALLSLPVVFSHPSGADAEGERNAAAITELSRVLAEIVAGQGSSDGIVEPLGL